MTRGLLRLFGCCQGDGGGNLAYWRGDCTAHHRGATDTELAYISTACIWTTMSTCRGDARQRLNGFTATLAQKTAASSTSTSIPQRFGGSLLTCEYVIARNLTVQDAFTVIETRHRQGDVTTATSPAAKKLLGLVSCWSCCWPTRALVGNIMTPTHLRAHAGTTARILPRCFPLRSLARPWWITSNAWLASSPRRRGGRMQEKNTETSSAWRHDAQRGHHMKRPC